jgi:hypothetical protein
MPRDSHLNRICKRSVCLAFLMLALVYVVRGSPCAAQTQVFTPSSGTLNSEITETVQDVLTTCQSWPPKLAKNENDQKSGNNLQDGTQIIINQLTHNLLNADPNLRPYVYEASFLRLLDSVGTSNPTITDSSLLGIAQLTDPGQLNLWGSSVVVATHDCLSLLSLAAQADAKWSIPIVSLNAAFRANTSTSVNQTSVFVRGSFQSPFDVYYRDPNHPEHRVFAGFQGLRWRLAFGGGVAEYIAAAQMISVTKQTTATNSLSLIGNLRAGLAIPIASLGGSAEGELTNSLKSQSLAYRTIFWDVRKDQLPLMASLATSVTNSLPSLVTDTTEVSGDVTSTGSANAIGWPSMLCDAAKWTPSAANDNYDTFEIGMTIGPDSGGLPTCALTVTLNTKDAVVGSVSDPRLSLTYRDDPTVQISLHLGRALHQPGKMALTIVVPDAHWATVAAVGVSKGSLEWSFPLHIDVPGGWTIASISAANTQGSFVCKAKDGSQLASMTSSKFDGAPPPGTTVTGSGTDVTLKVDETLLGVPSYNADPNQPNLRECAIYGVVQVSTINSDNHKTRVDSLDVQTGTVYFPNVQQGDATPSSPTTTPTSMHVTAPQVAASPTDANRQGTATASPK